MYSVCLNTAMTYHRKVNKGAGEYLQEAHLEIAEKGNPEEEQLALMFQTIATLSPVNKAITLLYLEDLSYDEIARITGVSKANVSVRLVRIKNELEEKMKRLI
jgi:RNA polymerase sigma-70 factor (ECF subfamily)